MTHPPIISPDGQVATEASITLGDVGHDQSAELPYLWCFLKKQPYEYVPDTWTFRIEIDGATVLTRAFEIYKP